MCFTLSGGRFYFFLFPADEVAFDGIEIHADNVNIPLVKQIFFIVFFSFDLFQRGRVIVQLEFKDIDSFSGLYHRIDPAVIGG